MFESSASQPPKIVSPGGRTLSAEIYNSNSVLFSLFIILWSRLGGDTNILVAQSILIANPQMQKKSFERVKNVRFPCIVNDKVTHRVC